MSLVWRELNLSGDYLLLILSDSLGRESHVALKSPGEPTEHAQLLLPGKDAGSRGHHSSILSLRQGPASRGDDGLDAIRPEPRSPDSAPAGLGRRTPAGLGWGRGDWGPEGSGGGAVFGAGESVLMRMDQVGGGSPGLVGAAAGTAVPQRPHPSFLAALWGSWMLRILIIARSVWGCGGGHLQNPQVGLMWLEFIAFESHLLGEASLGAAGLPGVQLGPPAWLEQRGQVLPASNLVRRNRPARRKDGGGSVLGSGQPRVSPASCGEGAPGRLGVSNQMGST